MRIRLILSDDRPRAFQRSRGGWREVRRGKFQLAGHGASALVAAVDSARDPDGVWVESCTFNLTMQGPDRIRVLFSRLVNNTGLPRSYEQATLAAFAYGEMTRQD